MRRLLNGKSEAWGQDRTGHKLSTMIAKYRRTARMAAEVGMGPFVRMDVAMGLVGLVARDGGGGRVAWRAPMDAPSCAAESDPVREIF